MAIFKGCTMVKPVLLIVEDEAIVADDIKETLISLGYTVAGTAKSGEIALEKIKEIKTRSRAHGHSSCR